MKKSTLGFMCIIFCILCSCSSEYSVDGYENFQTVYHSHYELNYYILPSEDFVGQFQYIDIDYHYREKYRTMDDFIEKSLVSISYEQEFYEQAKEYCIQNMQLSNSNTAECNGYRFVENIKLAVEQDRYGKPDGFPRWFNAFAYNDELRTLVFIGFYSPDYTSADAQNVRDNWGAFIEKHFSDIYNFSSTD